MFAIDRDGGVARVTICRAAKRNALPMAAWPALAAAIGEAGEGARLIVIASADPAIFCAGADIGELAGLAADVPARRVFQTAMVDALDAVRRAPVPVIAAIEGGCFGAGVALALACDVRLVGPEARFAITPARLGIGFPQPDIDALVAAVGRGQAARLLFGAETIGAEEALRIGLVEVIERDGMAAAVARIAASSPASLRALKAGLNREAGADARFEDAFGGPDFAEGVAAFAERRAPRFGM